MMSVNGPLTRLYCVRLPGLVRGREQSAIVRAMKPRSGAASLPDKLVYLIGLGEVVARLGRSFTDRLDRPVQIGDDFTDRNQLAALTLHSLFSHDGRTKADPEKDRNPKAIPGTPTGVDVY